MSENPADRIERALARIEAAAAERAYATERLARRHAVLRDRVQDALAALDHLIAEDRQAAAIASDEQDDLPDDAGEAN